MSIRIGPNRVGPLGLLQPIADGVKLLFKEVIFPTNANKALYVIGPIMALMPAMAAWAVIPFAPEVVLADINAGVLYILALTSMGVYGVIIAGWSSNSKYAFLGAMRSAAQMVSYELAMGFALVVVLMVSGSLNLSDIVQAQGRGRFAGNPWARGRAPPAGDRRLPLRPRPAVPLGPARPPRRLRRAPGGPLRGQGLGVAGVQDGEGDDEVTAYLHGCTGWTG